MAAQEYTIGCIEKNFKENQQRNIQWPFAIRLQGVNVAAVALIRCWCCHQTKRDFQLSLCCFQVTSSQCVFHKIQLNGFAYQ